MNPLKKTLILLAASLISLPALSQSAYDLYASSRGTNSVKRYAQNGSYLGDFVAPNSGGLSTTEDILFHPDGTVLVSGYGNSTIKRYNGLTGAYIGDFTSGYSLASPSKMSIGPDSLIYVTQWSTIQNKIARFDLQGNFVDEFTDGAPNGLGHVWDEEGNFYVALYGNGQNGTVQKFDTAGNSLGAFVNSTILQGPTSIWWDKNGDMLVEDWTVGNVKRYDSTGSYVGVFINGLQSPEGIAIDSDGKIFMGDWGLDLIHSFDSAGNALGAFASGNSLTDPNSVKLRDALPVAVQSPLAPGAAVSVHPSIFESQTRISMELPGPGPVRLELVGLDGQVLEEIVVDEHVLGSMEMNWVAPARYAAGVYFIRMTSAGNAYSQKIVLLR